MSRFVMGVYDYLVEEYHLEILDDNMNISQLIVNAQQVEETRIKRKNRGFKKDKSYEGVT